MSKIRFEIDPSTSYCGKIFLHWMLCLFVAISFVGFLSVHFFKGLIHEEIEYSSTESSEKMEAKLEQISAYMRTSSQEVMQSKKTLSALLQKQNSIINLFQSYRFGSVNVFSSQGDLLHSFIRNNQAELTINQSMVQSRVRLRSSIMDGVEDIPLLEYFSTEQGVEFVSYVSLKSEEERYFLELSLSIRKSYFEEIADNLGIGLLLHSKDKNLLSYPKDLAAFLPRGSEVKDNLLFKGEWHNLKIKEIDGLEVGVLTNIDHLVSSMSKIHFRIFLIAMLAFVLFSPLVYYLSYRTSKPASDLLERVRNFTQGKNQSLFAIHSEDEFGKILQELNKLFSYQVQMQKDLERKDAEKSYLEGKLEGVSESLIHLQQDYLIGRMQRRAMDKLIGEANYSQSFSQNVRKFLENTQELFEYLGQKPEMATYIRRNELPSRANELSASSESLSHQSGVLNQYLMSLLWFMELGGKSVDSKLSSQLQRASQLIRSLFPSLKIELELPDVENKKIDPVRFPFFLVGVLFLIAKQSRDGNQVKIFFAEERDKHFQERKILHFDLERDILVSAEDLDQEGKNLLRVLEDLLFQMNWKKLDTKSEKKHSLRLSYQL